MGMDELAWSDDEACVQRGFLMHCWVDRPLTTMAMTDDCSDEEQTVFWQPGQLRPTRPVAGTIRCSWLMSWTYTAAVHLARRIWST
jgi:hypothetical protein